MTYKADQEKKNKLLTILSVVVLILAVLPIVAFAVFSVIDVKPVPVNKSTVEEPTLSRSEIRKLEREKKKAEEEAAKQTVTQNQPVITTETMPQMGQFPGMGQFGPGMMGPGQFGNFDPSQMPQFDPSQFQGMGMGFGMGFGQGFDPANMPQFDPAQMGGFGQGFGGFGQGGMPDFGNMPQGGFGGGFGPGMNNNGAGFMDANGAWNSPPFNPNGGGPNIIVDPVQPQPQILPAPAGNQLIMINPIRDPDGNPINVNDIVRPRIGIPAQN